jgi:SAM-dependent methyltransferase
MLKRILDRGIRLLRNAHLDLRYARRFLGGVHKTAFADVGVEDTANTDYAALPPMFEGKIRPDDVLVDVGCGKGRVMIWWLSQGYDNSIVGLELDPSVAADTRRRLQRYPNVRVIAGDAIANLPPEGTVFYLFNPFKAPLVSRFKDQLSRVVKRPADLRIFYYNCVHLDVFLGDRAWTVEREVLDTPGHFHPFAIIRPDLQRR